MSASFSLTAPPGATSVSVYPRKFWAGPPPGGGDAPHGTPVATVAVDAHGYASLTGLEYETGYYVSAFVEGRYLWQTITTAAAPAGSGGGGAGTVTSVNANSPDGGGNVLLPGLTAAGALPPTVVRGDVHALGAMTGNVVLNLAEGHVFKGFTTGAVTITAITGFVAGARTYFEVEITGNHPITFEFLKRWRYGGAPPQDLTDETSVNSFMFFTDDGVAFYGVGVEGLPAAVVQATGTVNSGEVLVKSGSGYVGAALPTSGGLTTAGAETLIAEKAVLNGGDDPLAVSGTVAANSILVGASASVLEVLDLPTVVHELSRLAQATISSTGTSSLAAGTFYRVTAIEPTLVLPAAVALGVGATVVIENASQFPATVKGRFTPASETVSAVILAPGEVVTYTSDASATFWRPTAIYRANVPNLGALAGGYLAQSLDLPTAKATPTAKTMHICRIQVPSSLDVHELFIYVTKPGTLTAAYVGLYNSEGARLCGTEDAHVAWESAGVKKMAIGGSIAPVPGGPGVFIWALVLCVGSVMPELGAASFVGELQELNANLSASTLRNGEGRNTAGEIAAYSALPLTIDPAKNRGKTTNFPLFWVAAA